MRPSFVYDKNLCFYKESDAFESNYFKNTSLSV